MLEKIKYVIYTFILVLKLSISGNCQEINVALKSSPIAFNRVIITHFVGKENNLDKCKIIFKVEGTSISYTIKYLNKNTNSNLVNDSIKVSNIINHRIETDSLSKHFIVDDFYDECVIKSLWDYLSEKLKYPALAIDNGIYGQVNAKFSIEENGGINNIEIIRNVDFLGDEVYNVLNEMPKWLQKGFRDANSKRGKNYKKTYILSVLFRIEEVK